MALSRSEPDIIELGLESSVVPPRRFSIGSASALAVSIFWFGVGGGNGGNAGVSEYSI